MSDENTPETPETAKPAAPKSTGLHPTSILSNPSDAPARPGFRSPPNSKSKAQKAKKKK